MKLYFLHILVLFTSISYSQSFQNDSIQQILDEYVSTISQPGLTLGIVKNDTLIYHNSIGCQNLEYDIPFNDSTVFGLASVTKQLLAFRMA